MSVILFIYLFLSQSQATTVDLKKANTHEQNGQYLEAAKIYSTCLQAKDANEFKNLKKCLVDGESFGARLAEKVTNQALLDTKGKSMEMWKGLKEYKNMGLEFKFDSVTYIYIYQNEFSKKLKALFP